MRMMLKAQLNTAAANRAIADGSLPEMMGKTFDQLRPEAAYFGPDDGVRTAFFIFDLEDPAQIPVISEPLFSGAEARVSIFPIMTREDLQKGLQQIVGGR